MLYVFQSSSRPQNDASSAEAGLGSRDLRPDIIVDPALLSQQLAQRAQERKRSLASPDAIQNALLWEDAFFPLTSPAGSAHPSSGDEAPLDQDAPDQPNGRK